jgi:hypothetical protein
MVEKEVLYIIEIECIIGFCLGGYLYLKSPRFKAFIDKIIGTKREGKEV